METEIEVSLPMPNGETFRMKMTRVVKNDISDERMYYSFYRALMRHIDETILKQLDPHHQSQMDFIDALAENFSAMD